MVDYSKWKNIEVSDDEDDTHPNIDTPSLFRWRHQARVERMEERKKELEEHQTHKSKISQGLKEARDKLKEANENVDKYAKLVDADGDAKGKLTEAKANVDAYKKQIQQLEKEEKAIENKEEELNKKERKTPWNVDTISKEGFTKTVINKRPARQTDEGLTEEEREAKMKQFVKENEKDLKTFGMMQKYDDSRSFLRAHSQLVCENTANYLVIWCINLEMEDKHDLMEHVAHQAICMQFILELSKSMDCDPRACMDAFFAKIKTAEVEYLCSFQEELDQFKQRIRKRAAEKVEEAMKEYEEEERQKRLGPGGLDPVEVMESLPDELKKCFESQDVKLLQDTIAKMDEEQAKYHIRRCVDSGLWIPDANKDKPVAEGAATSSTA